MTRISDEFKPAEVIADTDLDQAQGGVSMYDHMKPAPGGDVVSGPIPLPTDRNLFGLNADGADHLRNAGAEFKAGADLSKSVN